VNQIIARANARIYSSKNVSGALHKSALGGPLGKHCEQHWGRSITQRDPAIAGRDMDDVPTRTFGMRQRLRSIFPIDRAEKPIIQADARDVIGIFVLHVD
jgi:hypothetical protein